MYRTQGTCLLDKFLFRNRALCEQTLILENIIKSKLDAMLKSSKCK